MRLIAKFLLATLLANAPIFAQDPPPETPDARETESAVETERRGERGNRWQQRVRRHREPEVQVRGNVTVAKGESANDIVVIAGTLDVQGEVNGNIVAVASEATINGHVRGSVVIVPGPVTFGPNAVIDDETVVVGRATRDPEAQFDGGYQPVEVPELVPIISGAKDFLFEGLLLMRPFPPGVRWIWVVHGVVFFGLIALSLLFPKPVAVGAEAIAERPVVSIFSGFLTVILFVPILVILAATVVGIVAIPFAFAGALLAGLFGKAAVMEFLGLQIARNLRVAFLESPIVALIVGGVILALLYMVPFLGMLAWLVATILGLGAIMVATATALNDRPTEPTPVGPPPGPGIPPLVPLDPTVAAAAGSPLAADAPPMAMAMTTAPVYQRVGFWKRAFSELLDLVLLAFPLALSQGFFPLVLIAYFVAMWTWKGTTIGKICLGLKIVRTDGSDIDFAVALVRSLASCFSFIVFLLGFFWAGWDNEKQSWHDKIAGTVVVQVPKGVSLL